MQIETVRKLLEEKRKEYKDPYPNGRGMGISAMIEERRAELKVEISVLETLEQIFEEEEIERIKGWTKLNGK